MPFWSTRSLRTSGRGLFATCGLREFSITGHIDRYRLRREQSRELHDPPTDHNDRAAHVGM
jgi:hypothetical protein